MSLHSLPIFTEDLELGMRCMKESILEATLEFGEDELLLYDVIRELCEEISAELTALRDQMNFIQITRLDNRKRLINYSNETVQSLFEFLTIEMYSNIPAYPVHCLNMCVVQDLSKLKPFFYVKMPPPNFENQKAIINHGHEAGEWFFVQKSWDSKWLSKDDTLGPINVLSIRDSRIDSCHLETTNLTRVSVSKWKFLVSWYGLAKGDMAINVNPSGIPSDDEQSDMWCFCHPDITHFRVVTFESSESVEMVAKKICRVYNVPYNRKVRLYVTSLHETIWKPISPLAETASSLFPEGIVLLVICGDDGEWPKVRDWL